MKQYLPKIRITFYFLLFNLAFLFVFENLVFFATIKKGEILNDEEKAFLILFFFLFLTFLIFLLLFLGIFFQQRIFRPLKKITHAIQNLIKKNFETELKKESEDEIGNLIDYFNQMVVNLKKIYEELEESKKTLEIRINARTRELQILAENLEKEVEKRTKELQQKITELEKFKKLVVGRELKMIELKKEIKNLKNRKQNKNEIC